MLSSACGSELPSPVLVDKLRLLDLLADPAEIAAGGTMTVRALWADGSSRAGRPVFFLWRLCAATAEYDARLCFQRSNGTDLAPATAGMDAVTLRDAELPAAPVLGTPPVRRYVLMLAMCPVAAPAFDTATNQYQCPSEQSIAFERREGIQAFRHVLVRTTNDPPPLNRVPGITRVNIAGMDPAPVSAPIEVATCPRGSDNAPTCAGIPLVLFPAPDAAESIATGDGGTGFEPLLASFFVTAGSTDRPRAVPSTTDPQGQDGALRATWYPPSTASEVKLWFTLRDGRGGDSAVGPIVVNVR